MVLGERNRWPWLPPQLAGGNTIVGIVELGVDTGHPALGGAVRAVWDLRATADMGGEDPPFNGPGRLFNGRDLPYRRDPWQHGTAVAAIVGGRGDYVGVAPECDLLVACGSLDDTDVAHAVRWIFDEARKQAKAAVVNLSLGGLHNDLHNGSDPLSRDLDVITGQGKYICVAAGNEGTRSMHVVLVFPAHHRNSIPVTVTRTDDLDRLFGGHPVVTAAGLGPWPPGIRVEYHTSPRDGGTEVVNIVPPSANWRRSWTAPSGDTLVIRSRSRRLLEITETHIVFKTAPYRASLKSYWTIEMSPTNGLSKVDLWASDGRLLFEEFRERTELDFDVPHSKRTMLGRPASARRVVTVGSHEDLKIPSTSPFSNSGKTLDRRLKPELVMPGRPPTSSYFEDMDDGTSFASARMTGIVALLAQLRGDLYPEDLQDLLVRNCSPTLDPAGLVDIYGFDYQAGFGTLNLQSALQDVMAS